MISDACLAQSGAQSSHTANIRHMLLAGGPQACQPVLDLFLSSPKPAMPTDPTCDGATRAFAIAVATKSFAVHAVMPHFRAGVGAAAHLSAACGCSSRAG
jgi:hypothetical protein